MEWLRELEKEVFTAAHPHNLFKGSTPRENVLCKIITKLTLTSCHNPAPTVNFFLLQNSHSLGSQIFWVYLVLWPLKKKLLEIKSNKSNSMITGRISVK